jgi:hypothetical protein
MQLLRPVRVPSQVFDSSARRLGRIEPFGGRVVRRVIRPTQEAIEPVLLFFVYGKYFKSVPISLVLRLIGSAHQSHSLGQKSC